MSTSTSGLFSPAEIASWKAKFNAALEPGKLSSKTTGRPWSANFWGCFAPIDLCAITCCFPCVTFGKVAHRMDHNGDMSGYEPLNTSCLLFYLSTCFGLHWVPQSLLLSEIREKHNLEGSCVMDLVKSCCCGCCALVQAEKETKALLGSGKQGMDGVVEQQYTGGAGGQGMVYQGQAQLEKVVGQQ
ncbi:PLAC8-domain-containing protein [Setomelanomma holmii]|uniref:PLAC8-domain-containing protein n=1 Tax=Setomelanomma holmii TaxID=210430 RepID=A0A9P4HJV9_9PLEO|nr:PLAC8-domain-containing protein [Setomelanomma holmii]